MGKKLPKSKHATDLSGVCLIHDNAHTNWFRISSKRKLWYSSTICPIHQTWVPVTFSCLLYWKNNKISPDVDISLKMLFAVPLFIAYMVCPKKSTYLHSDPAGLDPFVSWKNARSLGQCLSRRWRWVLNLSTVVHEYTLSMSSSLCSLALS